MSGVGHEGPSDCCGVELVTGPSWSQGRVGHEGPSDCCGVELVTEPIWSQARVGHRVELVTGPSWSQGRVGHEGPSDCCGVELVTEPSHRIDTQHIGYSEYLFYVEYLPCGRVDQLPKHCMVIHCLLVF